jgi:hypothetical protein
VNIILPLRAYKALSHIVSKDETRYFLNGIFLEVHSNGTTTATATDGRRMLVVDITEEQNEQDCPMIMGRIIFPLIPLAVFNGQFPAKREKSLYLSLAKDDPLTCEVFPWMSFKAPRLNIRLIEGVFPNIRDIIKTALKASPGKFSNLSLNPELLNGIFLAMNDYRPKCGITLAATGTNIDTNGGAMDPYLIKCNGDSKIFGILMPMRGGDTAITPDFLAKMVEEPEKTDAVPEQSNG